MTPLRHRSLWMLLVFAAGCEVSPTVPDVSTPDGGASLDVGLDAGATVRIRGTVLSISGGALEGASVRDAQHPAVMPATTDADGVFALEVPAGEPLLLEVGSPGWLTSLFPLRPLEADVDGSTLPLAMAADADSVLATADAASVPGGALLVLIATDGTDGAGGVVFHAPGGPVTDVFYFSGAPSAELDARLGATSVLGGAWARTDALPTPVDVILDATTLTGRTCTAEPGWRDGASSERLAAPIRPDAITFVTFDCTPPIGTRSVTGRITEYTPGLSPTSGAAVAGAMACVMGESTCATTDVGGHYTLDVDDATDLALTFDAAGREPILVPLRGGRERLLRNVGLPELGYVAATAEAFGAAHAEGSGAIEFFTGGAADVTVTLTTGTGDGAHYFQPGVVVDPTLEATSSQGWGFFFGVTPADEVSLRFHHADPTRACNDPGDNAWLTDTPETIRVPVLAGYTTFASLRCPAASP